MRTDKMKYYDTLIPHVLIPLKTTLIDDSIYIFPFIYYIYLYTVLLAKLKRRHRSLVNIGHS